MGKIRLTSLLLCLLVFAVGITGAQAQWAPDGVLVSDEATYNYTPQVVSDGRGGALVLWKQFDVTRELAMQRLDASGVHQWGAGSVTIRVNPTWSSSFHYLASDGAHGAFVTWRETYLPVDNGIYVQKVSEDGVIQWDVNGLYTALRGIPHMVPDGTGGLYVGGTDHPSDVAVQRLDAGGTSLWSGDYVRIDDGDRIRLLPDDAGGVFVGFQTAAGYDGARGQRLDGSGTEMWGYNRVTRSDFDCYFKSDLVSDGAGGSYWLWEQEDYFGGPESEIYAQRLDADGTRQWYTNGAWVGSFSGMASSDPQMVTDGFGGVLVVYSENGWDIRLSRMAPDGTRLWNVEVCSYFISKAHGRVAPDGYGGAFVVWEDQRGTESADLYAQHVDKNGVLQWTGDGAAVCTQDRDQYDPEIVATGNHSAIVAWLDNRPGDIPVHVYAQVLNVDGSIGDPPFEVYSTAPGLNAVDVPANTSIQATFSADVTPATLLGGNLSAHGSQTGPHGGSISLIGRTVTLNPDDDFVPGEVVTVVLTAGIESTGGKPLTPVCWSFTAEADGAHGGFLASSDFAVQTYPYSLCPADINGDGDMDLLVANYLSDTVSFMVGNGNGYFTRPVNLATSVRPRSVTAADLDGDGLLDAVTANVDGDDVSVFVNDGLGGLILKDSYDTGNNPGMVCAADFNGDGSMDLATASLGYDAISILINNGTGAFPTAVHYASGENPYFMTAADLDNDGDVDLVTSNSVSDDVSLFLNDGSGVFAPKVDLPAGDFAATVHPGDLDQDGDLDLVVGAYGDSQALVFFNNGDATFAPPVAYATGANPQGGPPSDVNGDGYLDLIYCNRGSNDVRVRHNDGNGVFGAETAVAIGTGPIALAAADFDGDGALDLVTANATSNDISLTKNDFGLSGVEVPDAPVATSLGPNVPNPFNPATRIDYAVHRNGHVRLSVYDLRGREIATLVDEIQTAATRSVSWDGRDDAGKRVASGIYFYRLVTEDLTETRKMVLVK